MKAQFKLMEAAELTSTINSVKTSGVRFDALVQRAAVQCVAQSILHRNITPGNDLVNALPKGSRRDSLIAWFEKFGNFAWMKADRKLAFYEAHAASDWTPAYAVEISASAWTSGTKQAVIKSAYDLEDEVSKFLDRMGKIVSDSTKTVEHKDLYNKLKATYTAYVVDSFPANDEESAEGEEVKEQLAA